MNSHKKIISFFVLLTVLVIPFQTIRADALDSVSDATSTPVVATATTTDSIPLITPPTTDPATTTSLAATSTPSIASTTPEIPNLLLDTATTSDEASSTPDPITINLEIDTATSTLFSAPLTVNACNDTPRGKTLTINGFCALTQSGLPVTWSWYDFGSGKEAFLDTISGIGNGSGSDNYWTWFTNLQAGEIGLNQHVLTANENLLVTIDRNPLILSVSTTTPVVGSTTTATLMGFNPYDFAYEPVPNAFLSGVDATSTNINGQVDILATSTDSFTISATADTFLPSNTVTITAIASSSGDGGGSGGGSGGGGGNGGNTGNTNSAFGFLTSHQLTDGSFDGGYITDWSALALALPDAPLSARAKLAHYLATTVTPLSLPTDYERHALALMSLGINPYNGSPEDTITPIVKSFNGTSVGDPGLDNPDIFALIALTHAGYSSSDPMINSIESFVLNKQKADGSWDEIPDLTAAAIQALVPLPNSSAAIAKAQSFLHSDQQADGGFANPDSTSWVLNALASLGQSPTSWTIGSSTPLTSLASNQQTDGGIGPTSENVDTRTWSTAYALTGFEGRSWSSLLNTYSIPAGTSGGGTSSTTNNTNVATTTVTVATSTPTVASTTLFTLPLLSPATTTIHYKKIAPKRPAPFTVSSNDIANAINDRNLGAGVAGAPAANSFWTMIVDAFSAIGSFFKHLL